MGHSYILLDIMGLDIMGLDILGLIRNTQEYAATILCQVSLQEAIASARLQLCAVAVKSFSHWNCALFYLRQASGSERSRWLYTNRLCLHEESRSLESRFKERSVREGWNTEGHWLTRKISLMQKILKGVMPMMVQLVKFVLKLRIQDCVTLELKLPTRINVIRYHQAQTFSSLYRWIVCQ